MPMECFGSRRLPDGTRAIETITRHGAKLLERVSRGDTLTENERKYLHSTVWLVNAILWEQTELPDYAERGTFRGGRGGHAFRLSLWWPGPVSTSERVSGLRSVRDALQNVVAGTSRTDSASLQEAQKFLQGLNEVVRRVCSI